MKKLSFGILIAVGFAIVIGTCLGCQQADSLATAGDRVVTSDGTDDMSSAHATGQKPSVAQLHAYKVFHHAEYLKVTATQAGGTNKLIHTTELPTEGTDPVVTPALDHLYSKAVIDLTSGPVVLEVPKVADGRYFSIHVTDQEHYTIYDEVRPIGKYVLVREGREGDVPTGVTVIKCPGDYPHLFIRVQIKTQEDRPNCLAIQERFRLTGITKPLEFDNALEFTTRTHDIYPKNKALLASVRDYNDDDHQKVTNFVNTRARTIKNNLGAFGPIDSQEPGSNDPEIRAAAIIGHLGLPAQHALYQPFFTNCDGNVLYGDNVEVFTFPYRPNKVKEFWSVTRYSLLTRNTLPGKNDLFNAYNTEPDAEGNVTVTFSAEDPKDETYWMPVNRGEPYYFIVRYYGPDLDNLPPGPCDVQQSYENTSAKITTRIGELEFVGGYPTQATIDKAFDQLDVQRATQAYLEFMPMMSLNAILDSMSRDYDMPNTGDVGVYVQPGVGKVEAIGLTYNTESIYATANVDLKKDGATVVETPPNVLGVVDDGWQRWLTDIGNAGPDKGKGGKYLLLPPGYEGEIPDDYFIVKCPTYRNWVMVRGFVEDTGTGDKALDYYRKKFRIYPLASGLLKDAKYVSLSFKGGDTTHPRNVSYFDMLNRIVQYEPSSAFTAYELGLLKSLGIEKGKPFTPDARMKRLLAEGVQIGDSIAKANAYANRLDGVRRYSDRKYEYLFIGGRHDFMSGDALWIDARTLFHYEAIVVTPAMAAKMVGVGSQYLACYRDADDNFLMGDNVYKLHLPNGIPAKNFWSVTAYHPDTRSLLQNGTPKPSISSYDKPDVNPDGSVDVWFSPKAPKGKEKNWIKTIPGEGWSILIRLYGPLESYFDEGWKPDDIVRLD